MLDQHGHEHVYLNGDSYVLVLLLLVYSGVSISLADKNFIAHIDTLHFYFLLYIFIPWSMFISFSTILYYLRVKI